VARSCFAFAMAACTWAACAEQADEVGGATQAIVAGEATTEFPTTGMLVTGGNPATLVCSGTLIGCDRFLTAAHCVCNGTGQSCQNPVPDEILRVYLQNGGFYSVVRRHVHPDFDFPDADVAVLELVRPAVGLLPTPLPAQEVELGSAATIAGFGRSGGGQQDYGIKQFGQVVTGECPPEASGPGHVCWQYAGQGSNTCNGDSGGPLFVTTDNGPVVAGITSGGTRGDCLAGDNSYDTSVFAFRDFIVGEAGGQDQLGQAQCGDLPSLGAEDTQVDSVQGRLTGDEPFAMSFEVAPGTAVLRVSVNSTEGTDTDLFVRYGSPATPDGNDCEQVGKSAYGYCGIESPRPGTWHVSLTASAVSDFQLVATMFGSAPVASDDTYQLVADEELVVEASDGVLRNDAQASRGVLTSVIAEAPEVGTVELSTDGGFAYRAAPGFVGQDRFLYQATDGVYAGTAEVVLDVLPLTDPDSDQESGGCGCDAGRNETPISAAWFLCLSWLLLRRMRGLKSPHA